MNPTAAAWLIVILILAVVATVFLLVLRIFAQMVVGLKHSVTRAGILRWSSSNDQVTLRADKFTQAPGEYALWWNDRQAHARIGSILSEDVQRKTIDREALTHNAPAPALPGKKAEWNGFVYAGPDDLDLPWTDVQIPTEHGDAPAWHFAGTTDTWVIHTHGIRVSRLSPLRGVPVFANMGHHSLVISYRGDGEVPTMLPSSTLGVTEWPDIEPAIDYAIAHGAKRILLSGWSMGGGMTLLAAERARNHASIDGLVLVAPTTNWREVILYGARQAKVPAVLGRVVIAALNTRGWCKLLGAAHPIDFDALDWTTSARSIAVPTLIIHSSVDDEVPVDLSRTLANANPNVKLVEIDDAFHTLEWNRDKHSFNGAITTWVQATFPTH